MGQLVGKTALVTGAARGLGRAIALRLAAEGATVAVGCRQAATAAESVAAEAGGGAFPLAFDTSVPEQAQQAVDEAVARMGSLDILVNNAGMLVRRPLLETDSADWRRTLEVNLGGYFHMCRAAVPVMPDGGAIINISSVNATLPSATAGAYAVSKAGVSMLTRQLAMELADRRIRVNEVCPGTIETDLNRRDLADGAFRSRVLSRVPLQRLGNARDVASAVVFLAGPDAGWVTGASLAVDGGTRIG